VPRYKLTIEYDGTGLVGWQRQAKRPSSRSARKPRSPGFCGEHLTVHGAAAPMLAYTRLANAHISICRRRSSRCAARRAQSPLAARAISVLAVETAPRISSTAFCDGPVYL